MLKFKEKSESSYYTLNVLHQPDSEPGGAIAKFIVEKGLNLYEMRRTRPT